MMTTREYAERIVEDGLCDACGAVGCNMRSICDGFQKEVDDLLKEWEDEEKETS